MTREELLKCPEYWTTLIQNELYRQINCYMEEHNMNKSQLAEHLGCSRGYVTQLLNGEFDHKISKLVELSLAIGMAPSISFKDLDHADDSIKFESRGTIEAAPYFSVVKNKKFAFSTNDNDLSVAGYTRTLQFNKLVG